MVNWTKDNGEYMTVVTRMCTLLLCFTLTIQLSPSNKSLPYYIICLTSVAFYFVQGKNLWCKTEGIAVWFYCIIFSLLHPESHFSVSVIQLGIPVHSIGLVEKEDEGDVQEIVCHQHCLIRVELKTTKIELWLYVCKYVCMYVCMYIIYNYIYITLKIIFPPCTI